MKYNAYIVQLKHKDLNFTGILSYGDTTLPANFKKIGKDLFLANFKCQLDLVFQQRVPFKDKSKEMVVMLPEISKYNKRKLTKISKFLAPWEPDVEEIPQKKDLLLQLITVDKFVKVRELLDFFAIESDEIVPLLVEKEIKNQLKIIDFLHLTITSYETIQDYCEQLDAIMTDCYTSRIKSLKISEIDAKLKLPQQSILFKYLLKHFQNNFPYQLHRDRIVFQKFALSETEKISLSEIEVIVKKSKLSIFTIENILHWTDLSYKDVNDSLWFLVDNGQLVQLNDRFFIFTSDMNKILNKLKKFKRNQGEIIDIQSFRELTNFSRKYIISLFEYFDLNQITERVNNRRKILLVV